MKLIRKTMALMAVFAMTMTLILASEVKAQAAPASNTQTVPKKADDGAAMQKRALRSIFSADWYADKYPDVVAVLGDDPEVLFRHCWEYGIKEGRDVSPIIDMKLYRVSNPDLVEAFGDDWGRLLNHFIEFGIYETANGTRHSVGVLFNPIVYMNEHPEVQLLAEDDLFKVIEVYISEGMPEGIWSDMSATTAYIESMEASVKGSTSEPTGSTPETNPAAGTASGDSGSDPADQPPEEAVDPLCSGNHAKLYCEETCEVCGQFIDHDFGPSSEPYCRRCHADFVQIKGCAHEEWYGGTCKKCWKVDRYYSFHDTLHIGEFCPDCKFAGTIPYNPDECPSHDYGDGENCIKCGYEKPAPVVPEENPEKNPVDQDINGDF